MDIQKLTSHNTLYYLLPPQPTCTHLEIDSTAYPPSPINFDQNHYELHYPQAPHLLILLVYIHCDPLLAYQILLLCCHHPGKMKEHSSISPMQTGSRITIITSRHAGCWWFRSGFCHRSVGGDKDHWAAIATNWWQFGHKSPIDTDLHFGLYSGSDCSNGRTHTGPALAHTTATPSSTRFWYHFLNLSSYLPVNLEELALGKSRKEERGPPYNLCESQVLHSNWVQWPDEL